MLCKNTYIMIYAKSSRDLSRIFAPGKGEHFFTYGGTEEKEGFAWHGYKNQCRTYRQLSHEYRKR